MLSVARLKADLRELYFTFLQARQYAISQQEDYGLRFDNLGQRYILFSAEEGDIKVKTLRKGIKYKNGEITFGGDAIMTFKPLGTAEGGHVTLTSVESQREYEITVSGSTGRVRFEKVD